MKTIIRILFLCGIISLSVLSCGKEDYCDGEDIKELPILSFKDFCPSDTVLCILKDYEWIDRNYKIDNEKYFNELIECYDDQPVIDFSKYTLLFGQKVITSCGALKYQKVLIDCMKKECLYQVKIYQAPCDTEELKKYHAIVPKLPENYKIIFNIEFLK